VKVTIYQHVQIEDILDNRWLTIDSQLYNLILTADIGDKHCLVDSTTCFAEMLPEVGFIQLQIILTFPERMLQWHTLLRRFQHE
jgi:hypothetical protein